MYCAVQIHVALTYRTATGADAADPPLSQGRRQKVSQQHMNDGNIVSLVKKAVK